MLVELPTWQGAGVVAIRLPDLAATRCKALITCGVIQTEDVRLLKWMKRQGSLAARYGSREGVAYVHAEFNEGKRTFHLDVVAKDYVGKSLPAPNKVSEIQEAVAHVQGQTIDAMVEGYFRLPKANLPPIIRSAMVESESEARDVSIKTIGGTFLVRGAPIYLINWQTEETGDVLIHLVAKRTTAIEEKYLESAFELIDSAIETFVRGG